jgi:hypothetical protein
MTTQLLAARRAEAEAANEAFMPNDLVFSGDGGRPLHPAALSYYSQRRIKLSGVLRIAVGRAIVDDHDLVRRERLRPGRADRRGDLGPACDTRR